MYSCGDDKRLIAWSISSQKGIRPILEKKFFTWGTAVDGTHGSNFYAAGTLNGQIIAKIPIGSVYSCKEDGPIRSLKIFVNKENCVYLIVSIHGRGVKFIPLYSMSSSK